MKAILKNYRQSPQKVRLVADLIRGKKVSVAQLELDWTPKRATTSVRKLLDSAVANATQNFNVPKENLFVKEIQVNEGVTLHRWRPRARGVAFPIRKRTSHITIVLGEKGAKETKAPTAKKMVKKTAAKKVTAKKSVTKKTAAKKSVTKKTAAKKDAKKTVKKTTSATAKATADKKKTKK